MKRFSSFVTILLISVLPVCAQSASGILFNRDIISASSLTTLSQREVAGTARSMGMGGAFTSLGGDMASLGYNPAGFGMYQRNEVSATIGAGIAHAKNYNAYSTSDNTKFTMAINNVGASFKVYEGTGKLTAVNFAFGYNKTADYNYNMAYAGGVSGFSLADAFADIANANGLVLNADNKIADNRGNYDYDMDPYYWGAVMGYKGGLINRGTNGWYPDEIGPNAEMSQYLDLQSRGSAGEFSFAFGFNFSNIVYLGASLDIQSVTRKQTIYYDEYIGYGQGLTPDAATYPYQLNDFRFAQSMAVSGSGVGAKFGIVVRPVESLRIGFAVHTPTYYSMSYRYVASLSTKAASVGSNPNNWEVENGYVYADETTPILKDNGEYRWTFTTPTRLLAGISYAIGPYAVISADYEYNAYRALKWNYTPADPGYDNGVFRSNLLGTHSVRAGVEGKPTPWLSLRVGGGFRSKLLVDNLDMRAFSEPVANDYWYASAGLGFRLGEVTSIDVAYQYRNTHYSDYYTFYTKWSDTPNASPIYGLDMINHNIAVTFAFRF